MIRRITITSLIIFSVSSLSSCEAQRSDPSQFNGGSVLAMAGRNSVAIAIDARFGLGFQTISTGMDDHHHHKGGVDDDDVGSSVSSRIIGEGNPRILQLPNSNVLMAWTGLFGDGIGFAEEMNVLLARKVRKAGCMDFPNEGSGSFGSSSSTIRRKKMSPRAITTLMSHLLYRRRNAPYYVEPVVVGLENVRVPIPVDDATIPKGWKENIKSSTTELQSILQSSSQELIRDTSQQREQQTITQQLPKYKTIQKPYLCGTDMLGAQSTSNSFVCSGVASRSLHGTAEALWRPNLDGNELVEVCGKAFVSALERDILSGYGAVVYLIQGGHGEDGTDVQILEFVLACRND